MLRTTAALGKNFAFRDLAAVSSASDDALLDVLDEASAAQLIRANPSGSGASAGGDDSFAFTHDKIREVLYEELDPIRRRRLHQRIGESLEELYRKRPERPPHAQDLAHHFMQAGDLPRSLKYSRRAAANAERMFAHDEALKFLEQARESAEALHLAGDLHAIHEQIGDIQDLRGTTHPAIESFQRALAGATSVAARAALNAGKIGKAYCAIGDALQSTLPRTSPRGVSIRGPRPTRWRWPPRRWAATFIIEPSTQRRSNCSSARGSWPSRSTTPRRCAMSTRSSQARISTC